MKIALFPGSFDPPTLGHLDVIKRASLLFDKLYIAVSINAVKKSIFTADERVELIKTMTEGISNLEVLSYPGLIVDLAKEKNVNCLIRGLRAFSDFEYEFRMALANRKIGEIETLFLMSDAKFAHISGTLIKELVVFDKHLEDFVPANIEPFVFQKLKNAR